MINLLKSDLISKKQKERINKAHYQCLYLLEKNLTDKSIEIKLTGSTLNIYTITINDLNITCDCPDIYQCNKYNLYCKHICFVICMIGKIYCTDIFMNKKLKEEDKYVIISKLFNIFDDPDPDPDIVFHMLLEKYNILKLKMTPTEARNKEEECSICYNKLDTDLYTCHICSNAIHNTCLDIWIKTNNICIFCRNTVEKESKYLNISK
jgi:uncharacterized Zn finger protein